MSSRGSCSLGLARGLVPACAALLLCLPANAVQPGTWVSVGPDDVEAVLAIAVDPSGIVYAGTQGAGVYRIDSLEGPWTRDGDGLTDLNVNSLAIDPRAAATVWAATLHGVFRRSESGTWIASSVPSDAFDAIFFDPLEPSTMLVAARDAGVYRSSDSGASWTPATSGLASGSKPHAFAGTSSGVIYLATLDGGIYRSADHGSTWLPSSSGLGDPHVASIAASPSEPSTVYAGTLNSGVFKSVDGGQSWARSTGGIPLSTWASSLAVDPANPSVILAGTGIAVYRSIDSGETWKIAPGVAPFEGALVWDRNRPGTVYAGAGRPPVSGGGVFLSTDHGATWRALVSGIRNVTIGSLRFSPRGLYAGLSAGLVRTVDRGSSWQRLRFVGGFTAIAFDPTDPDRMYLGSVFGMDFSTDGGLTIFPDNVGLTDPNTHALAVDPTEPSTVYLGNDAGLSRSTDRGESWAKVSGEIPAKGPSDPVFAIVVDPSQHQTVYAATKSEIFKTSNATTSWTAVGGGIPSSADMLCLVVDPASPSTLYAGTTAGVYKTTTGGGTWTPARSGMSGSSVVALVVDVPRRALYAATEAGVFASIDGGGTWSLAGTGLVQSVTGLVQSADGDLYAGTDGAGVFLLLPPLADRGPVQPPAPRRPKPREVPPSGP